MKIKKTLLHRLIWITLIILFTQSVYSQNPTYLCELRNDAQLSSTIYEFDIYLLQTGSIPLQYAAAQFGVLINPLVKNGGIITPSIVPGSSDAILTATNQNPTSVTYADMQNCIRVAGRTPPGVGNGAIISNSTPGTRICRIRLTNSVPFGQFQPNLSWTTNTIYPTTIAAYVSGSNVVITDYPSHTTSNLNNSIMNPVPTVNATATPGTICVGNTVQLNAGASGGSGSYTYSWTSNPAGFTSTISNPVVTPSLTTIYSVDVFDGVSTVSDQVTVTVNALPTVSAGAAMAAICKGDATAGLGGSFGGSATGATWTSSAGGTFNPSATTLNATWSPPVGYSGTATLTLTTSGGSCGTVLANKTQLVNPLPTVSSINGGASSVCIGSNTPAFTNATNGGVWSVNDGTGSASITSGGVVTGVTAGSVTVVYTVSNSCGNTSATQSLTVNALPEVGAGSPLTAICQGQTSASLGGSVGGSATGGTWSTPAGGTFSPNANNVNATWTPSPAYNGTATLTLTTTGSPCGQVSASKTQLVNPNTTVQPISGGAATVCVGSSTPAFTDATGGGTWSITPGTGAANITAGGVVTGISSGSVTVVYTVIGTCGNASVTQPMTINALPTVSSIGGGSASVCAGSSTPAFTDATGGGTWSINPGTGSATITSGGVVTGTSAGSVTVIYTVTNSCSSIAASQPLTVNAVPTVSAGGILTAICQGETSANLGGIVGGSASGGTWTSTAGGTFNPNATTLNATWSPPLAYTGTATLTLTTNGGLCGSVFASKTQVVNATSSVAQIAGGAVAVCAGSSTPAFTDATAGGTWSITPGTGTASITTGGVVTGLTPGTVTVTYTVSGSCGSAFDTQPLTVNAIPLANAGSGLAAICQGGISAGLGGSFGGSAVGATWSTTAGGSFTPNATTMNATWTPPPAYSGNATLLLTTNGGSCGAATSSKTQVVNPIPVIGPQTSTVPSGTMFIINPTGGTVPPGTLYTWSAPIYTGLVSGGVAQSVPQASINGTLTNPSGTGTATYIVTPVSGSCPGATFTATVTVNATCVPVTITTQPVNTTTCATSGIASLTVVANGTAPFVYQWQYLNGATWAGVANGLPVGAIYTNSGTASMNVTGITTAGNYQYRCFITNCGGGNNITSSAAILTVNALPVATLISSDPDNTFCLGVSVTFTATGGQSYDFRRNGVSVQTGTTNNMVANNLANGEIVSVLVTNAIGCSVSPPQIVNTVTNLPTITISSPATCSANFLTYSVGVTVSAGATVTSASGTVVNTSGNIWTISAIPAGVTAVIRATTAGGCQTPLSVTAPDCLCPVVTAPVSGGNKAYCAGSPIPALTATVLAGETIDWYGTSSAGTILAGSTLSYTPTAAGTYYALARNIVSNCTSSTRTAIVLTMNTLPLPTLVSSDIDNTFCAGTSVTFTAGGGTTYTFRVAGVNVLQSNLLSTFTTNSLTTGQSVDVIVTNATGCSATSTPIINTVSPLPVPILVSSDADNSFCAGTSITFSTSSGTNYNFRVGGVSVQNGISNTYTTSTLTNGQIVDVIASNAIGCAVTSLPITNTVSPQPIANGGAGGNVCDLKFKFTGVPSIGLGTWTKTTGPGTAVFTPNANTANATVTVSEYGAYTFTWTEVSGTCYASSIVSVNFYLQPVANAGTGGNNCGLGFHFSGTLNTGVGTWAKVSGPGNVTFGPDANTPNALATVTAYGTYTFSWTVVNGTCSNSSNVNVVFIQQVPANGGTGGNECDKDFILSAVLPTNGTGTWTKFSGPGNVVFTPDNHTLNAKATVDKLGVYDFAWTVVNSTCSSSDVIRVVFHDLPAINAGRDTTICAGSSVQLKAVGTGTVLWTPSTKLNNPNVINPIASPDVSTTYSINITDQFGCKNSDNLVVSVLEKIVADAGPDQDLGYVLNSTMDASLSHTYEKGVWSIISGTGDLADSTFAKTSVENLSIGLNEFLWTVTNGFCPLSRDTANIVVNDFVIPSMITPNMDGRNDYFELRGLSTLGKTELVVFDRRGSQVYKNLDYDNSWDGVDYNKDPLPDDTYFYVLKSANGKSISGYIVIRR